jgi:hypothetical protein
MSLNDKNKVWGFLRGLCYLEIISWKERKEVSSEVTR